MFQISDNLVPIDYSVKGCNSCIPHITLNSKVMSEPNLELWFPGEKRRGGGGGGSEDGKKW